MDEKFGQILRANFLAHHVDVRLEWLVAAVDFCRQKQISDDQIAAHVFYEWLNSDLRLTTLSFFQPSDHVLTQRIVLQVLSIVDISRPSRQPSQNGDLDVQTSHETVSTEELQLPHNRMFKMRLTDEKNKIWAIEHRPIPGMSAVRPGCKLLIRSNVRVHKKTLLMTEQNIQILGGSVREIAVSEAETESRPAVKQKAQAKEVLHTQQPTSSRLDPAVCFSAAMKQRKPKARTTETQMVTVEPKRPLTTATQPLLTEYYPAASQIRNKENERPEVIKKFKQLKMMSIKKALNFVKHRINKYTFTIVGRVKSILEKLHITDDQWTLRILLADESGDELDCRFDAKFLDEMVGITAKEALEIKQSKNRIRQIEGQEKLRMVDANLRRSDLVFDVEFHSQLTPVIRRMETLADRLLSSDEDE
ncbi:RecQ-mediated genome instability protein 1-like protein [Aphelenchoides besseyi]|nr:RecQ-mediated genome instability protein 1-like protein [Aphelenchoides besseyi]KAI6192992.1 RecQ-mediated genome instability protein 1-like protein [Aphelenchoides besseyi]